MKSNRRLLRSVVCAVGALLLASGALAQNDPAAGSIVRVTTTVGESIGGLLVESAKDNVVIESPTLGKITVPRSSIQSISAIPAEEAAPFTPPPPPPPPAEKWSGRIELGITGQSGNTERLNFLGRAGVLREIPNEQLEFSIAHRYNKEEGNTTENRGEFRGRNTWQFPDTRWDWFLQGRAEWDEFEEWDYRLSLSTGPGYRFIDEEKTFLRGYLGAGVAREFGSDRTELIPEALAGFQFWRKINDHLKWVANGEIYPDLIEFGEFRAWAETSLDINLSEPNNLVLRVGIRDEYDSLSTRERKNDLFYFASFVYGF